MAIKVTPSQALGIRLHTSGQGPSVCPTAARLVLVLTVTDTLSSERLCLPACVQHPHVYPVDGFFC